MARLSRGGRRPQGAAVSRYLRGLAAGRGRETPLPAAYSDRMSIIESLRGRGRETPLGRQGLVPAAPPNKADQSKGVRDVVVRFSVCIEASTPCALARG